jgi:hypothetical protein
MSAYVFLPSWLIRDILNTGSAIPTYKEDGEHGTPMRLLWTLPFPCPPYSNTYMNHKQCFWRNHCHSPKDLL